jgi:hypothetical protein
MLSPQIAPLGGPDQSRMSCGLQRAFVRHRSANDIDASRHRGAPLDRKQEQDDHGGRPDRGPFLRNVSTAEQPPVTCCERFASRLLRHPKILSKSAMDVAKTAQ